MLSTQYRMHPDISHISNRLFYSDELMDGIQLADRIINDVFKKHFNFLSNDALEEKKAHHL